MGKILCVEGECDSTPTLLLYDQDDLFTGVEPDELSKEYTVKLVYKSDDDDFETIEEIGFLSGTFINLSLARNEGYFFLDVFDAISDEISRATVILDEEFDVSEKYVGIKDDIFYINRIYIHPNYRGKRLAKWMLYHLEDLLSLLFNLSVGCILLEPAPFNLDNNGDLERIEDEQERQKLVKLLKKYYLSAGLKEIPESDLLYRNTNFEIC